MRAVIIGRSRCRLEVRKKTKSEEPDITRKKQTTKAESDEVCVAGSRGLPDGPSEEAAGPVFCGDVSNRKGLSPLGWRLREQNFVILEMICSSLC